MIISVQRGMNVLKNELSQRGYKVVFSDEYSRPVDVYIYSLKQGIYNSFPEAGYKLRNFDFAAHNGGNSKGIIEINAFGKSLKEIEEIMIRERHGFYY